MEGVGAQRGAAADPGEFYFFYTTVGGGVYLNALMMKMLMHQAGQDPLRLPHKITCKIQDVENFARDEKSPKFLSHLPVSSRYSFIEGMCGLNASLSHSFLTACCRDHSSDWEGDSQR